MYATFHFYVFQLSFFFFISPQELALEIKAFISGVDQTQGRKLSVRDHAAVQCASFELSQPAVEPSWST